MKANKEVAKGFCKTVITVLQSITTDTLPEKLETYVSQLSEFSHLQDFSETAKKTLEMVCSNKISTEDAIKKFEELLLDLA